MSRQSDRQKQALYAYHAAMADPDATPAERLALQRELMDALAAAGDRPDRRETFDN